MRLLNLHTKSAINAVSRPERKNRNADLPEGRSRKEREGTGKVDLREEKRRNPNVDADPQRKRMKNQGAKGDRHGIKNQGVKGDLHGMKNQGVRGDRHGMKNQGARRDHHGMKNQDVRGGRPEKMKNLVEEAEKDPRGRREDLREGRGKPQGGENRSRNLSRNMIPMKIPK